MSMKKEFRKILNEKGRTELPRILLVSAECAPISKTGGLADVVGTLPKSLRELGIDARVITPYHRCVKDKYADRVEHMFHFYVNLGWRTQYCGIERLEHLLLISRKCEQPAVMAFCSRGMVGRLRVVCAAEEDNHIGSLCHLHSSLYHPLRGYVVDA